MFTVKKDYSAQYYDSNLKEEQQGLLYPLSRATTAQHTTEKRVEDHEKMERNVKTIWCIQEIVDERIRSRGDEMFIGCKCRCKHQ